MKKILSVFALAAMLVAGVSCTKDDKGGNENGGETTETGISLDKTELTLMATETANLVATLTGEIEGSTVKWETSDRSVATVSKGKVTAKGEGSATITASVGDYKATCAVTVTPYDENVVLIASVSVTPAEVTIVEGRTETLSVTILPENATNVPATVWNSSDEAVATVAGGVVTAVKAGEANITATVGNHVATCKVTVITDSVPTTEIVLTPASLQIGINSPKQFTVTFLPENHTDEPTLSWSSGDTKIATVDADGFVTGVAEGKTTITASYGTVKAAAEVEVIAFTKVANLYKNYLPVVWSDASKTVVSSLGAITVEWMMNVEKWTNDANNTVTTIFGIEGSWLIRIGDIPIKDNQLELAQSGGNWDSNTFFDANKWYHVALVQDGTKISLYVNGQLADSGTARRAIPSLVSNCYISRSWDTSRYIQGSIAEMRVWKVARTEAEIAANMYSFTGTSDDLVAYWKFDDGEGRAVKDYSGNGNDLTANSDIDWREAQIEL